MKRTLTQPTQPASLLRLGIIMLSLIAASCASLPGGRDTTDSAGSAQALARGGDHMAASRAYLDLALENSGATRQRYLILAAGELYLANELADAERILAQAGSPIDATNLSAWAEVTAELHLARNRPQAALDALNQVASTDRQAVAKRILLLRSEALFQLGRVEPAVATLLQRAALLSSTADIEANQRLIWSGLQGSGNAIPPNPVARNGDPILTGWLQLGHIAFRERASLNRLYAALTEWRGANRKHPASGQLLGDVLANLNSMSSYPQQVALLLPLSGPQKSYGEAIRDGYLAAHFELGENATRPEIRIYDTEVNGAMAAYQRATLDGAGFVVGPLFKNQVAEIAPAVDALTTLALNVASGDIPHSSNLFQFALAPEHEARAVAARATSEGRFNAVALVEESEWGKRILTAFQAELSARNGQLLAARSYPRSATDFSDAIQDVLLLDESYARRDRLAANLGKKLEFEPRRRQDVDFIFIASRITEARQIKPQLKFHYAGDIPTYATSDIYQPDSQDNSDLNGIMFPDIPWLLEPGPNVAEQKATLARYWGASAERRARYYALGYDSYHLTAVLHGRSARKGLEMRGMTGQLWVDDQGLLHRELKWARMERGTIRTLPDAQRSLAQGEDLAQTLP